MEVDDVVDSSQNSNGVHNHQDLWKFINAPVIAIFSDLQNTCSQQTLHSLLDSILKGSASLKTVLVPPFPHDIQDKVLLKQFADFTTWLFGIMFYITSTPLSSQVLEISIEIQACMLRILSSLHYAMFKPISLEYMNILEELLDFDEHGVEKEEISLSEFQITRDAVENLDLIRYPIKIHKTNLFSIQVSILKIIIGSSISAWNISKLWDIVLKMMIKSPPEVKVVALELCVQILVFCTADEKDIRSLIIYSKEIVRTIPIWNNLKHLSPSLLNQYGNVIVQVMRSSHVATFELSALCFEVIDLTSNQSISLYMEMDILKSLAEVASSKIVQCLTEKPRSCTSIEIQSFFKYIDHFAVHNLNILENFYTVLINFIIIDIKKMNDKNNSICGSEVSELWKLLKIKYINFIEEERFEQTAQISKASRLLDFWCTEIQIQVQWYGAEFNNIVNKLVQYLNSGQCQSIEIIFDNFIALMAHREANKDSIQPILLTPFAKNVNNSTHPIQTKLKCLDALCEFGNGKHLLKVLNQCIISNDQQLAVKAILNSVLLLKDENITIEHICHNVLNPALSLKVKEIQKAIAIVIGQISCYSSGNAIIKRKDKNNTQWTVHCRNCTNEDLNNDEKNTSSSHDHLLSPFLFLLNSDDSEVRLSISQSFQSLSNHMESFNSNKVAKIWLKYMQDGNSEIRHNVGAVIGTSLNYRIKQLRRAGIALLDNVPDDLEKFVTLVINVMADTLEHALNTSNSSLHDTVLITAKNFACVPLFITERRVITIFLHTLLHPNSSPAEIAAANVAYQDIAGFLNISPKALYCRYRKDFLKLLMQQAVRNHIDHSYNLATSIHRVAKCFGFQGCRELLCKDGHFAVCFLLSFIIQVPKASALLNDLAELTMMDEKHMLTDYFPHICSHMLLNEPNNIATECLKQVSKMTGSKLGNLINKFHKVILKELMLNFYESPEKIIVLLELISEFDGRAEVNLNTQERVAAYLEPELHAILVNLDGNLNQRADEYTQQSALASLTVLLNFMGSKYLTPLRYKILAMLRTSLGLTRPRFRYLSCEAWNAFLHNIKLADLGPLLPTICVSMIPLLESHPQKTNAMWKYLIVENNEGLSNYISELFFIDDIKLPKSISHIVKARILQTRPERFDTCLRLWLKRITHQTDEVRVRALAYLQKFLVENRGELNKMILGDTNVHPLIVELLDTLLTGCQDKDENIRLLYGECLGELGAIEPSLLPRKIIPRNENEFIYDMNDQFICVLLCEFVHAFQMQDSTYNMNCFSLAIQEILVGFDIRPQGKLSNIWKSLPTTTQQIITPFLTSFYTINTYDDTKYPHPVYGSEAGSSVESWAYNWFCSTNKCVKNETLNYVLQACAPALKRCFKTLVFCLPHIVAHTIINGTDQERKNILEEMITVINVKDEIALNPELLQRRPLRRDLNKKTDTMRISDEAKHTRCSQIIFSIIDYLQQWLRERRLITDKKYQAIAKFCGQLNSLMIAQGCYHSQEYHRALMYLEQHMTSSQKGLSEETEGGLLAKIYAQLDDPDGLSGILATQNYSPTLQQLVLAHEVGGQLQDAAICYERLAQNKILKPAYLQGMIQCYLGLDQPYTAMNITQGVLINRPELEPLIVEHEPFWRLAHFTRLDDTLQKSVKDSLLEDLKKGLKPDLTTITSMKKNLVSLLGAASRPGGYQQCYSSIMKLHILNEFDKTVSLILSNTQNVHSVLEEWGKREQLVRASRGVEFVLGMRRAILNLALQFQKETKSVDELVLKEEIGKIWLKSSKIARKAGLHQQAYMYILSATEFCSPQELYIEQAQLYWQKNCQEDAFTTLKRCFSNCFQPSSYYEQLPIGQCTEERKQCAKAKLLFAKYNDETLNVDTSTNIKNYKEAIDVWKTWEKSFLYCAQYYESIFNKLSDESKDSTKGKEFQIQMMNYYGKSLSYGCKYIHQSMPKMLTIWLNLASRTTSRIVTHDPTEVQRSRQQCLLKMTNLMSMYETTLPTFMWLTAFSQLVSRICHPSTEVQNTICSILVKLISRYPQHCLWMMASVFNSSYPVRQTRCQEILQSPELKTHAMSKLIGNFNKLWEALIELSSISVSERVSKTTLTSLSRKLPRLLASSDFSAIMIPNTKFRQIHLPSKGASMERHHPFPIPWVHITGVEDEVALMASLQRPKRISLRGSDGKIYMFMCKSRDDLRRDFRFMEFNEIVNKYLQNDPESRQRRLYIRVFSVVPLTEDCGLIEWIPNLIGLRPILMSLYKEKGIAVPPKELKSMLCDLRDPLEKKRDAFLQKLIPRHPPLLGEWFRLSFPDPYGWYEARTAYIRTAAVMSMVGYILGLGDRHGENVLFDCKSGDCVHVDFNCLFNKGELLEYPERVPFRLTHNMIEAMGPLKYEGPFRRACQITMRVLRQQTSTLLSVLTPFVYDPLVSWNRNQTSETGEKTNEKALENVNNIEQRLKGVITRNRSENIPLCLSIEGQTNHLILEATNVDSLCQMWYGWGPYL